MEKTTIYLESSNLYRKIDALGLIGSDRQEVMGALMASDRVANAIYGASRMIDRVSGWLAPGAKPKHLPQLKHQ